MLVIEGSDNLGKTVAAHKLVKIAQSMMPFCKVNYNHMGRPKADFTFGQEYRWMCRSTQVQDRFHYGSLVWHDNVMTPAKFSVIEGWIRSLGGMVVVFVASDEQWYSERLQQSSRAELFKPDFLLQANMKYLSLAGKHADEIVTVGPDFVSEATLERIASEWTTRIKFALEM